MDERNREPSGTDMSRVSLTVGGMDCTGCEKRIAAALGRLEGVGRVEADYLTGTVVIEYDPAAVKEPALIRRLEDAGYELTTKEGQR